jgi:hypothetical protein
MRYELNLFFRPHNFIDLTEVLLGVVLHLAHVQTVEVLGVSHHGAILTVKSHVLNTVYGFKVPHELVLLDGTRLGLSLFLAGRLV